MVTCNLSHLIFKKNSPSTFVGSAWSFGFFIPATAANDLRLRRICYPRFYPLHLFSFLNSWERASISFLMFSAKQTTGTTYITPLTWCGPWGGIEPGTSRTRSQYYTTRLSMRRFSRWIKKLLWWSFDMNKTLPSIA